uniref:Uncharacterized protein n=1 Tax=Kwoniella dejecticola CBS 10117 TaxID=1296121 RepID=A0A1A6A6T8_9TREE|nr:uncharacterized protein I303_03486 [Kwoniella dejecticola CBS 10117]OBR85774.1 hypothetical protein I303_03486 [Kwoniella dejecticola CBS 10117]
MAVIQSHPLPAHPAGSPFLVTEYKEIMIHLKKMAEGPRPFDQALDATWLYLRACQAKLPSSPQTLKSPVPPPTPEFEQSIKLSSFPQLDFTKPFNVQSFRNHIDGFILPLTRHLRSEIDTLTPDLMDTIGVEGEKEVRTWLIKHLRSYDPSWFLCSTFASVPIVKCKQLLQLPLFVRRLLLPFVLAPKFRGYWLYAPYPENLTFSGTA